MDKLIAALSPVEQNWLWDLLGNLKEAKSISERQSEVWDFVKTPPRMEEFIDSDYYLGQTLKHSDENVGIYPAWQNILVNDFNYESRIHNAVVTGSLGIGKTWIMVTILLYRIVLTTLLRNPQHYFGISRGSNIIFNILSVTREQVRQTAFGDAVNFMTASPYFLEELKFDPEMEYSKSVVPFNNNIFLTAGSKGWHVLGRNVLGVGLDEGNFRLEKDPDVKAYALYDQVRTRLANRFQKIEGFLPAISVLASSASDESSFTETVVRDIEQADNQKTQNVYRLAVYVAKRNELKLGKRWFKVAYGLRNMEPCLLSGWYLEDGSPIVEEGTPPHEEQPKGSRTELVPEMYWPDFRRNCRVNLQSVSGISTGGTHRLLPSMVDVERCFRGDTRVITFDGIRPIRNLAGSKHLLLTQNAPGTPGFPHPRWIEAEVKGFGRQRLWKLLLRRNRTVKELFATAEHRWFVYRKKWDKRLIGKTTADLRLCDQIPSVYGQRILFRSESPTGVVLSPYGVVHGITFGDGHLASIEGIWPQQPARTVLFGDKDAELADWFLLKTRMKAVTVESKLGSTDGIWVDDLPRFFKKLPNLDESPGYLLGWLAGYFAADGCVDEHGLPLLASASRKNLEFAELLALRFGIRTNGITETLRQGCANVEMPIYNLLFHVGSLPNDFFLLSKHRERNRIAQRGSMAWTVECVEETECVEDVFCAVVPETGCFVLEGNIFTGNCIELSEKEGVPNPMKEHIRYIPVSVEDQLNIWDYMTHSKFLTRVASRVQPIRHPQSLRYAHLDLATQSKAGVAICHLVGGTRVEGIVRDGMPFDEYRLVVEYDFILTLTAGQVKPINFDKICKFFFWLRDMCGYRFGLITADWFQCLAAGTRIWTRRGSLPIEEVKIGDKVQSGAGVERLVTGVRLYKKVPVFTLVTSDKDELTGTPNHRLGVWRRSLRPKSKSSAVCYEWVRLDEVRIGDVLQRTAALLDAPYITLVPPGTIEHEHGCRLKTWTAPGVLNEDLAVWLGIVYGDGCASVRNGFRVAVNAADVSDAQGVFAGVFGFSPRYSPRTKEGGSLGFMCQAAYRWLLENGLMKTGATGRKGNRVSLTVPESIFRSPRSVKAAFLRGVFSADGNAGDNISLSTKHKEFAVGVLLLLREFGIDACLVPSNREGFGKKSVQWHVKLRGARALFQPIGFCYKSKQQAFESSLGVRGRKLFVTVTKVKLGIADVYDIAVEKDHSYVANGFVSHNSEMPLQNLEAAGFKVDKQSLDKDKAAYTAWRTGFEDQRMRLYRSEEMLEEAEKLTEGDKKYDHPDKGCFTGDTRIALLDGTVPTFEQLAQRFPNGVKFPVFSMSQNGICAGFGHSPRVTKRARIVEVLLDNFQVVRCTVEHLFMLLDGSWIEAQDLKPEMSLMPLYRSRERKGGWLGYERVWCPVRRVRLLTHQMVARQLLGGPAGRIVHHVNEIRHDNSPSNLEYKTLEKHAADHTRKRHETDSVYVDSLREGHKIYRLNGGNQKSRENILRLYAEGKLKRGRAKCSEAGCESLADAKGKCGKHYQLDRRKALRGRGSLNHSVLSVVLTDEEVNVWDITVDDYENFALASGVFVHNSKDTTDACAGSYFNAINSEERTTLLTYSNPSVYAQNQPAPGKPSQDQVMELPMPTRTYRTVKEHTIR